LLVFFTYMYHNARFRKSEVKTSHLKNFTLEHTMETQKRRRDIALLFL